MKIIKNPFCIICSVILIVLHTSFAAPLESSDGQRSTETTTMPTSTLLTPSPSASAEDSPKESRSQGRSIRFPNNYDDLLVFAPIQDPYNLGYDDAVDVVPTHYDPALPDSRNGPSFGYPLDRIHNADLSTAESNIVFRPLFTYRRQTAQRRKVYSPASSSSSNGYRRRVYRYPVYYYSSYPNYYYNAQYDYVP